MFEDIEKDFILPNTLSAMAKTFYVSVEKPLRDGVWSIKKGSTVTGVKVISQGEKIRDVQKLVNKYPLPNGNLTDAKDWHKVRGTALITDGVTEQFKEIHWYQCENIGKVDFKLKRWGDEE